MCKYHLTALGESKLSWLSLSVPGQQQPEPSFSATLCRHASSPRVWVYDQRSVQTHEGLIPRTAALICQV